MKASRILRDQKRLSKESTHSTYVSFTFDWCNDSHFEMKREWKVRIKQRMQRRILTEIDDDVGMGVEHSAQGRSVHLFDDVGVFFFGDLDPAQDEILVAEVPLEMNGSTSAEVDERRKSADFECGRHALIGDFHKVDVELVTLVVDVLQFLEDSRCFYILLFV